MVLSASIITKISRIRGILHIGVGPLSVTEGAQGVQKAGLCLPC